MTWWQRILRLPRGLPLPIDARSIPMRGWNLVEEQASAAYWRDSDGDATSLTFATADRSLPPLSATAEIRSYCRRIAESQNAGLIEVGVVDGATGPSLRYIYKRLTSQAFTVFGVATIPVKSSRWMWMIVANEHGMTGVREAVVTAELFEAGKLTPESYESSWAQDPYDPTYGGVDRSTLRYKSDAEDYDAQFPNHPLSKVRRHLDMLLTIPLS